MKAVGHKSPDAFRPVSTYKLSDIISNVNPLDSEFLKYIPASMLDRQQVEGRNEGIRKEKLRIAEIGRTIYMEYKQKTVYLMYTVKLLIEKHTLKTEQ